MRATESFVQLSLFSFSCAVILVQSTWNWQPQPLTTYNECPLNIGSCKYVSASSLWINLETHILWISAFGRHCAAIKYICTGSSHGCVATLRRRACENVVESLRPLVSQSDIGIAVHRFDREGGEGGKRDKISSCRMCLTGWKGATARNCCEGEKGEGGHYH